MMDPKPYPSIERVVMAMLERDYEPLAGKPERVGGDFPGDLGQRPWYIRLDRVPGGVTNWFQGDFIVDVETFGKDYVQTESVALDVEALLVRYPRGERIEVDGKTWILDDITQNVGVADAPWEDETVNRFSSTYAITARRR